MLPRLQSPGPLFGMAGAGVQESAGAGVIPVRSRGLEG